MLYYCINILNILISIEFILKYYKIYAILYHNWRIYIMKSIGKILQYYRKQNNMTQSDLAAKMSEYGYPIKNGAISTWEKDYSIPNAIQFLQLCEILGITDIYKTFIGKIRIIPLRMMGVSAGTGEYVGDDVTIEDYIETSNQDADYALRINGDSMTSLYPDDSIVLVHKTEILNNGDIGIFYLNGEQYCKKIIGNQLISINPNYKPIDINNLDYFRILGKVVN